LPYRCYCSRDFSAEIEEQFDDLAAFIAGQIEEAADKLSAKDE
jgi:hypothetical protein